MREKFKTLKQFNWGLFTALCAMALIPAVYQTVRTFIVSSSGSSEVFDIIGQMEWFDLINETILAFLVIPLYSVLNQIYANQKSEFPKNVYKTGIVSLMLYTLFSVGVLVYGAALVGAMNPSDIDITVTSRYLGLETVAFMVGIIISFVNVVFVVVGKVRNVYIFLGVRTALSIIADVVLIPLAGVYGVALSNIVVNGVLAIVSLALLYKQGYIHRAPFSRRDIPMFRQWAKVGVFSGAQQFLDNIIYAVMVCKMVNMVAEQGNYWLANNFIWGWLLIPIGALSEVIRRDCGSGYKNLRQSNYYIIGALTASIWAITIPLWPLFFRYAQNLSNADVITEISVKLVPFYVAYIGCAIIDNIFVGLGKTVYNTITSVIVNIGYYGFFYILYVTGAITFTMDTIILMFGLGMVVHLAISVTEERLFLRKREGV